MSWVNDTLLAFGRQLGLETLAFSTHGVAQLEFQSGAVLSIEPVQRGDTDEVLIYLSRPVGFAAPQLMRQALHHAHFKEAGVLSVQVALRGQGAEAGLIALVRLPARDFTLQALDQAFNYLNHWHDSLAN